jgi:hypothetical protein
MEACKELRIQEAQKLTDPTDPDPEHWYLQCKIAASA